MTNDTSPVSSVRMSVPSQARPLVLTARVSKVPGGARLRLATSVLMVGRELTVVLRELETRLWQGERRFLPPAAIDDRRVIVLVPSVRLRGGLAGGVPALP